MDFYANVHIIKDYIQSFGFEVELFSNELPEDISGRTIYNKKRVLLSCPTAEEAFYTILHEAGHVLSYQKYFIQLKQQQPAVEKREAYAYLYGWYINKHLNLGLTKEEWREKELN